MPRIIKDRAIVEDGWQVVKAGDVQTAALPTSGRFIVPLAYWHANRMALLERTEPVGVWLDSHEEPDAIAADLPIFPIVAVNFPKFADGRGYSIARLLRERYGYQGELRAIGDVLRDQLFYMSRCGFNAFAVRADRSVEDALSGLSDFSEAYQISVERPVPLFRRRLA